MNELGRRKFASRWAWRLLVITMSCFGGGAFGECMVSEELVLRIQGQRAALGMVLVLDTSKDGNLIWVNYPAMGNTTKRAVAERVK